MSNAGNRYDLIVVGGGPAGMFCAYEMLQISPGKKILIIERGKEVQKRSCPEKVTGKCMKCKPFCNITNGSSGAGAFSDGKLSLFNQEDDDFYVGGNLHKYLGVDQTKKVITYTDEIYLKFGATTELQGVKYPAEVAKIRKSAEKAGLDLVNIPIRHLGTDKAHVIYKDIENYLKNNGVTTLFETEVTDLIVEKNVVQGVMYKPVQDSEYKQAFADKVVLAVGRGGADWLEMMCKNHQIVSSPAVLDVGVRFELPDTVMSDINTYMYEGKFVGKPNPFNDKVRTFCQNPSGFVSAEVYKDGLILANGHSCKDTKSNNTNLALLVSISLPAVDAPMEYSRNIARNLNKLASGQVMVQRLGDVIDGRKTLKEDLEANSVVPTLKSAVPGDISLGMPFRVMTDIIHFIYMMDKVVKGFADGDNLLYGPELKFYSNKVELSNEFETSVKCLYAVGDGCGLTRGLMMASASGVQVARNLCK